MKKIIGSLDSHNTLKSLKKELQEVYFSEMVIRKGVEKKCIVLQTKNRLVVLEELANESFFNIDKKRLSNVWKSSIHKRMTDDITIDINSKITDIRFMMKNGNLFSLNGEYSFNSKEVSRLILTYMDAYNEYINSSSKDVGHHIEKRYQLLLQEKKDIMGKIADYHIKESNLGNDFESARYNPEENSYISKKIPTSNKNYFQFILRYEDVLEAGSFFRLCTKMEGELFGDDEMNTIYSDQEYIDFILEVLIGSELLLIKNNHKEDRKIDAYEVEKLVQKVQIQKSKSILCGIFREHQLSEAIKDLSDKKKTLIRKQEEVKIGLDSLVIDDEFEFEVSEDEIGINLKFSNGGRINAIKKITFEVVDEKNKSHEMNAISFIISDEKYAISNKDIYKIEKNYIAETIENVENLHQLASILDTVLYMKTNHILHMYETINKRKLERLNFTKIAKFIDKMVRIKKRIEEDNQEQNAFSRLEGNLVYFSINIFEVDKKCYYDKRINAELYDCEDYLSDTIKIMMWIKRALIEYEFMYKKGLEPVLTINKERLKKEIDAFSFNSSKNIMHFLKEEETIEGVLLKIEELNRILKIERQKEENCFLEENKNKSLGVEVNTEKEGFVLLN